MKKKASKEITLYNGEKIMVRPNSFPINPDKFREIVSKRGLALSDISSTIGYAPNSISGALYSGYMNKPMIVGVKTHFGIDYSEYEFVPEEKKPEPVKEPEQQPQEEKSVCADETALYQTMKLAMKDAMTEWFADNVKNLRGTIYAAIMNTKK